MQGWATLSSANGSAWPPGPVWIVLPTYNEVDCVGPLLWTLLAVFDEHAIPGHVLVVDDDSPDGTAAIARAIGAEDGRVEVLHQENKEGLGPAYVAGFRAALSRGAALVVQMDCDFSHRPAALPGLVEAARHADVVLGSRYVPGGAVWNWSPARRWLSRLGCWYARSLLDVDVRDLTGGFKCFRREVLERLPLDDVSARGYGFQIDLTYRALQHGFSVHEHPIEFTERTAGSSKMSLDIVLEAVALVPRLRRERLAPVHEPAVPAAEAPRGELPPGPAVPAAPTRRRAPDDMRLGQFLCAAGALDGDELGVALHEQSRSGGRLGEVLVARGAVEEGAVIRALSAQLGLFSVHERDQAMPLLNPERARSWRAVAIAHDPALPAPPQDSVAVAFADPASSLISDVEEHLGVRVRPRLLGQQAFIDMHSGVYGRHDAQEMIGELRRAAAHFSAFSNALSRVQLLSLGALALLTVAGFLVRPSWTAVIWTAALTLYFVCSVGFRLYLARQGWKSDATISPSLEDLAQLDEQTLPSYTILVPLYGEKPSTVTALFEALGKLDYPRHKLQGLLLVEADDARTQAAVKAANRPPWLYVLQVPEGEPRTKPRAMLYGLRFAQGSLLTVYDAEDHPEPLQLRKAAWAFAQDDSLACLQAKLGFYNPRQNVLTRWFTLEYDAWFSVFLPGLHLVGAPIPLGGTSNHFRTDVLRGCHAWDPYNVTEDADLGLRLARLGLSTGMLESVTGEEANSQVGNWLRQRSRWIKGYLQTLLVHTRDPRALVRELGVARTLAFLLVIGGSVLTHLVAPLFWLLLATWVVAEPAWVAGLFPGAIYYPALVCLALGNFLLVYLGLHAAVARGHDDLAAYSLLMPAYWLLQSIASYIALVELVVRPHHWHKTEHGLHFEEQHA